VQIPVGFSVLIQGPGDPGSGNWWDFTTDPPSASFFSTQGGKDWLWIQANAPGQLTVNFTHNGPSGPGSPSPMVVTITPGMPGSTFQVDMTPTSATSGQAQGSTLQVGQSLAIVAPAPSAIGQSWQFTTSPATANFFSSQGGTGFIVITGNAPGGLVTVTMTGTDANGQPIGTPVKMQVNVQTTSGAPAPLQG
jgi:hypothetical protein